MTVGDKDDDGGVDSAVSELHLKNVRRRVRQARLCYFTFILFLLFNSQMSSMLSVLSVVGLLKKYRHGDDGSDAIAIKSQWSGNRVSNNSDARGHEGRVCFVC